MVNALEIGADSMGELDLANNGSTRIVKKKEAIQLSPTQAAASTESNPLRRKESKLERGGEVGENFAFIRQPPLLRRRPPFLFLLPRPLGSPSGPL